MIPDLGDFLPWETVYCPLNTVDKANGAPITLAGTPLARVHKDNNTTEDDSGITLTVDFDTRTGLHVVAVDLSADAAFYTFGGQFTIVLTQGTVDGVSVVGNAVGRFTIGRSRGLLHAGTLAGISATTATLPTGHGLSGMASVMIQLEAGTNARGKSRVGSLSGDTFTPDPAWNADGETTPSGTIRYTMWPAPNGAASNVPKVDVEKWRGTQPNALQSGRVDSYMGAVASAVIAAGSFAAGAFDAVWTVATRLLTAGTNIVLGKGTGVTGFNDLSAAQVNAEVDTALADIHLDHLLAADYDPAAKPGVGTALLNELVENDAGVSRFTANALEQAPTGGGASAAAIADAVLDELLSEHTSAGTLGKALADILDDTGTSGVVLSTAQVNAIRDAVFARTFDGTKMQGFTFEQVAAFTLCAVSAILSGANGASPKVRNVGDSADAIQWGSDATGRTSATYTPAAVS